MDNKYTKSLGINIHPTVFGVSVLVIISIIGYTLFNLSEADRIFNTIQHMIVNKAGWFYIFTVNIILGFSIL